MFFYPPTPKKDMAKRGNLGSFPNWLQSMKTFSSLSQVWLGVWDVTKVDVATFLRCQRSWGVSTQQLKTQNLAKKSCVCMFHLCWWYLAGLNRPQKVLPSGRKYWEVGWICDCISSRGESWLKGKHLWLVHNTRERRRNLFGATFWPKIFNIGFWCKYKSLLFKRQEFIV